MGLLTTSVDGIGAIAVGARAGQILQVTDAGTLVLAANHALGQIGGHYSVTEMGGAGGFAGVGLNEWLSGGVGTGAVRTPSSSEAGWFNGSGTVETGTTTTGSFGLGGNATIQFSSVSGTWFYELTFSLPVLSDGTNTYTLQAGFIVGNPTTAGAVLKYTHSANGGRFQFAAASAGVTTNVDSGVTLVAGNYYHARIEVVNNGAANFFLNTTFSGTTWSDTGVWGAPLATISTNVPSGSIDRLFCGFNLQKSAGTTSVKMKWGHMTVDRIPPFTRSEPQRFISDGMLSGGDAIGQALGAPGNMFGITSGGTAGWSPPNRIKHPFVAYAYGHGGFVGSNPHDFSSVFSGTSIGAWSAECVDNSLWGTTGLINNFSADGAAAFTTAPVWKLDSTVNPLVFETILSTTTLSTGGSPFNSRGGFLDSVSVAPSNGIFVELDSNAAAAIQCKVRVGGVTTTVSTGITIVANTYYFVRIIALATSISFYVAADDAAALTTPIATITTNIPTGVAMCAADVIRSTGATVLCKLRIGPILVYSRSTT